jgi:hypothetical protein
MFPTVDLSRMVENPPCVIHVSSLEEAKTVIYNAKNQFPERVKNWDIETKNHWGVYEKDTGYTMFYEGEDKPTTMSYSDIQWFEENGYEVIEFAELLGSIVDIEESDQPVAALFGGAI